MNNEILDAIKKFTEEQSGIIEDDIREDSILEKDLGIYGDDAVEYILAFGKKFNVDVSRFMAADYFSSEGSFLPSITSIFTGKERQKPKELAILHLVKAIKAGRLDEEVINS